MALTIEKSVNDRSVTYHLAGALDTTTAHALSDAIEAELDTANEMIFDLKDLTYLSSVGLRIFLSVHKLMLNKGGMKIVHVNDDVMSIFVVMGFMGTFSIS